MEPPSEIGILTKVATITSADMNPVITSWYVLIFFKILIIPCFLIFNYKKEPVIMFCTNCGKEMPENFTTCALCGCALVLEPLCSSEAYEKTTCPPTDRYSRPLSVWEFFIMQALALLPIFNVIVLAIWAFAPRMNFNRRAFSRAVLVWFLLAGSIMLSGLIAMLLLQWPLDLSYWFLEFRHMINSVPISEHL